MKKYTCSEIRKAKGAIIVYPTMMKRGKMSPSITIK